ncbi:hypothetical protein TNCV_924691 [Trichonephila clavipes]|nr:hypothetical protein TNCV_924691 [Trichonephila clavipes]
MDCQHTVTSTLTMQHRENRQLWCFERQSWVQKRHNFVFSRESLFELYLDGSIASGSSEETCFHFISTFLPCTLCNGLGSHWVNDTPISSLNRRRDFSSLPEIDESHLVRDQDCRTKGVHAPNEELHYG